MPGDPTATTPPPQHVRIGVLGRAFQLEGGIRLRLDAGTGVEGVRAAGRLFVAGYGPAAVRGLQLHGNTPVIYLEGVRDREGARALTGAAVYAAVAAMREAAAPAGGDAADLRALVGAPLRLEGRVIGLVREVRAASGNPLLVVAADAAEVLLPVAAPYVRIDAQEVRLVDPPEGLLPS